MKTKFLITFFLLLTYFTYSQKDTTKIEQNQITKTIKSNPIESKEKVLTELDYYKLLSEQAIKDNQTYVSLFQWTIGISFGFLLAIIGSQIFFNYRINKKEIDYIKKDLEEKIAELKNEINQNINSKFDDLEKELKTDLTKNSIDTKKTLSTDFKTYKEYLKLKLEVQETSLKQELKILEKEVEKNKGDLWKLKGVESNALSSFVKSAFLQIELKRDVKYILDEINEVLGNLEEINSYDYNRLNSLAEKTMETHKEKTEKMLSLFAKKPVYEFVNSPDPISGMFSLPRIKYIKNKK